MKMLARGVTRTVLQNLSEQWHALFTSEHTIKCDFTHLWSMIPNMTLSSEDSKRMLPLSLHIAAITELGRRVEYVLPALAELLLLSNLEYETRLTTQ